MPYVSSAELQEWLAQGVAYLVPEEICHEFGEYLSGLPWNAGGSGLDWEGIDCELIDLALTDQIELSSILLRNTSLGANPYIVLWYSPSEPGLICEADFAIAHVDEAFWRAPGRRYMFGADIQGGAIVAKFESYAEYDSAGTIVAIKQQEE